MWLCVVDYVLGLVDEVVRVCGCVLWTTYLAWLMKRYVCVWLCVVDYALGLVDEAVRVCGCVLWTTYLAWLIKWYVYVAVCCGLRTWPG